jgi:hypothetical protein
VERERALSAELKDDVKVLEEQLSCVKALGHSAVHEYASMLGAFGCVMKAVATDAPVFFRPKVLPLLILKA